MIKIPRLSIGSVIALVVMYIFLAMVTASMHAPVLLMAVLMVWLFALVVSVNNLKDNIAGFCFLLCFFVFLIGREVCFSYLGVDVYYIYLTKENDPTFISLMIALFGFMAGSVVDFKKSDPKKKKKKKAMGNSLGFTAYTNAEYIESVRFISKIAMVFCYIFAIISVYMQIIYIRKVGYVYSYSAEAGGANVPGFVAYPAAFYTVALFVFLSSLPTKVSTIVSLAMYELYGILSLLTGIRFTFVAVNMLILIYIIRRLRKEDKKIPVKIWVGIFAAVPVLMIFLSAYESIRLGQGYSFSGVWNSIKVFLDNQGGSVNNIKRVLYFSDQISELKLCSFENTKSVLFENLIARRFFDVTVYSGNSLEHALNGNSLAHRLSYYTYGTEYLKGRGVGSCYIAELLHDFGNVGVFIGSAFYGNLIRCANRVEFESPVKSGLLFAVLFYILLAPRGGFDLFVGGVFGVYSLFGMFLLLFFIKLYKQKHKKARRLRTAAT